MITQIVNDGPNTKEMQRTLNAKAQVAGTKRVSTTLFIRLVVGVRFELMRLGLRGPRPDSCRRLLRPPGAGSFESTFYKRFGLVLV
jgi:hypothetical protein